MGMAEKEKIEQLKDHIAGQLKKWEVPSASVCIVKDGKVLFSGGIGMRDGAEHKADGRTLYQIASCTKAFTATAAAVLATEGKLDFDRPIVSYMPSFRMSDPYATEHLTVRDFLSHRSGLPRHEMAWYGSGFSRERLMENLKELPLNAPIRYRFQYSNFNYLIVGCLIEAISGMKFEDFLMEKLLKPLGMEHSRAYLSDITSSENHALAFDREEKYTMHGMANIPYYSSPAENREALVGDPTAAAGCIVSCSEDMTKWLKFNLDRGKVGDRQLVSEELMDVILSPHIDTGDGGAYGPQRSMTSYGLGWSLYNYRGHKMAEHGGNINGFSSSTAFLPEQRLGVFVSVNMNVVLLADAIVHDVIDTFLEQQDTDWYQRMYQENEEMFRSVVQIFKNFGGEPVPGTQPSHPLTDYAGDYGAPGYRRLRIICEQEKLTLDFNTFVVGLKHHHYDSFATEDVVGELPPGVLVTFGTDPAGEITTASVMLGTEQGLKPIIFEKNKEALSS